MVKFETAFNSEATRSATKMQMKKLTWVYILVSALWLLMGVIELLNYLNGVEDSAIGLAIFWMVFGVMFYPLCRVLTLFVQKKLDKSMPILNNNTLETYEFYEDKITILTKSGEMYSSSVEASYKYIHKIVENKESYFLYISKVQCHVVMKKFLVEGSFNELNDYFVKNFNCITAKSTITYKNKVQK